MTPDQEVRALKRELMELFQYIQKIRTEIAAIHRPDSHTAADFHRMSDELDAITAATEDATNSIMEAMERNEEMVEELRGMTEDPKALELLDKIVNNGYDVFQACSFQDITGQRVTKVVRSVKYIEERVNAVINVWGKQELEKVDGKPGKEKSADEKLLNGPQLKGEGVNQADVDALFGGGPAKPAAAKPAAPKPQQQQAKPAPAPQKAAAKPAAPPPKKAEAPKPAPKMAEPAADDGAPALDQSAIDALFD